MKDWHIIYRKGDAAEQKNQVAHKISRVFVYQHLGGKLIAGTPLLDLWCTNMLNSEISTRACRLTGSQDIHINILRTGMLQMLHDWCLV